MEQRHDPMEWKYDPMEERYDPMEWKYDRMEERYDPMEWKYDPVEHGYDPRECKGRLDCIFVQNAPPYQSVSGHSSEQSTAYFCSRPTVSQLKLIWESPNTKDTNFHRHTIAPFRSKLESNRLQIDHDRKFSERIFSTLAIFEATSKFFGSLGCSDDKNWLELSSNFFRICRFRSSILVSLQVFIPREASSSQVWQWRDFPGPITILCYA